MNDLVLTGNIIYKDKYAFIDKFKTYHFKFCKIVFAQVTTKTDGERGQNTYNESGSFAHTFIVNNIC